MELKAEHEYLSNIWLYAGLFETQCFSVIISLALIVVAGVVELWDLVTYILMKLLWLLKILPINVD
jgi:hypothetical protein